MQRAMGATGLWTIDGGRASMEVLPPLTYLAASYYQRWFLGLGKAGEGSRPSSAADEIAAGHSLRPPAPLPRKPNPSPTCNQVSPARGNFERPAIVVRSKFKVGDRVRTKNLNPTTHTRLPRYARGKEGMVEAIRGCHVYPDTAALDVHDENPQWLYTVVFTGKELWGEDAADPAIKVSIECIRALICSPA